MRKLKFREVSKLVSVLCHSKYCICATTEGSALQHCNLWQWNARCHGGCTQGEVHERWGPGGRFQNWTQQEKRIDWHFPSDWILPYQKYLAFFFFLDYPSDILYRQQNFFQGLWVQCTISITLACVTVNRVGCPLFMLYSQEGIWVHNILMVSLQLSFFTIPICPLPRLFFISHSQWSCPIMNRDSPSELVHAYLFITPFWCT